MSQIEDAMDGLMTAIRNSGEFIRYQAIKEKVHGFPKLESQITEFRKKNYLLQNMENYKFQNYENNQTNNSPLLQQ